MHTCIPQLGTVLEYSKRNHSQDWKKCIKNDIFIEFLLVRNQHLLRPSIIIIIVIAFAVAVDADDDDDEIKLLSIQKYRFWSNGFKAYTFQLGFFSFLLFRYRINKKNENGTMKKKHRSDPVVHGHCRPDRFVQISYCTYTFQNIP